MLFIRNENKEVISNEMKQSQETRALVLCSNVVKSAGAHKVKKFNYADFIVRFFDLHKINKEG